MRFVSRHAESHGRDLLHRHYTVHGRDGSQEPLTINGMIPKSAGRTPIACINCAKTKTKCDKKFPCTRCATRNLECTVRPTRRALRNPIRPMAAMHGSVSIADVVPSPTHLQSAPASRPDSRNNSPPRRTGEEQAQTEQPASPGRATHDQPSTPPPQDPVQASTPPQQSASDPQGTTPSSSGSTTTSFEARMLTSLSPDTNFFRNGPYAGFETWMSNAPVAVSDQQSLAHSVYGMYTGEMTLPMTNPDDARQADMLMAASESMDFAVKDMMPSVHTNEYPLMLSHYEPGPGLNCSSSSRIGHARSSSDEVATGQASQPSFSWHRSTSSYPSYSGAEAEAIIFGQNSWSAYRCTPSIPAAACPKSARINLQKLEESLRDHECWTHWRSTWDEVDTTQTDCVNVVPFREMSRDKLLAITQTFLYKAFEIHSDEPGLPDYAALDVSSNFVILPPARVLEHLLKAYTTSFERFYPLVSRGVLDPNVLMLHGQDKAASLLLLLMIAQGALITPSLDGRWLTAGLTEACRISLFDVIEKNMMLSGDPVVLHAALLFTVQAGWSGDKWQMDIAMGQRGMYFSMLRHSGYLENPSAPAAALMQRSNIDMLWQDWMQKETRSRLVYSWVMVDQDLSLFHDTAPMFSVTELGTPMPDTDALWHAKSAIEWSGIFERVHEFAGGYSSLGSGARPLCLRDLFRLFANEGVISQGIQMTPLHLRLLLHPLHSLLCQFRQLLTCLPDINFRTNNKSATTAPTHIRLEEIQSMLQRWYGLASRYLQSNSLCPVMQANLIMFHLVSLNAVTDFSKIEQMARREGLDESCQTFDMMRNQCITEPEKAIFHCGQTLRLIRIMPRTLRPPWWAAAMYRIAMVMWCDSLGQKEEAGPAMANQPGPEESVLIDRFHPEHPAIVQYTTKRQGKPALTRQDGSQMPIQDPAEVLFHCIDMISEGVSTRFTEGVCSKLTKLATGCIHDVGTS